MEDSNEKEIKEVSLAFEHLIKCKVVFRSTSIENPGLDFKNTLIKENEIREVRRKYFIAQKILFDNLNPCIWYKVFYEEKPYAVIFNSYRALPLVSNEPIPVSDVIPWSESLPAPNKYCYNLFKDSWQHKRANSILYSVGFVIVLVVALVYGGEFLFKLF